MIQVAWYIFGAICSLGITNYLLQNKRVSNFLYAITALFLIVFCGVKDLGVDQDSIAYFNYYYNLDSYALSLVAEPSFYFISEITRYLSYEKGLTYLFFVYAFLGVFAKFWGISRLTDLRWLTVLVYFSSYFLLHEFTQIRAGVACGLVLISTVYIRDRKLAKFLITIFVASLFHYSALLTFPLYLLGGGELDRKMKIIIASSVPAGLIFYNLSLDILYIIPIELVKIKVKIYMEAESLRYVKLNVFNYVYLIKYFMLYVYLFFSDEIQKKNPYFPVMIKMYAISLFSYLALSFNSVFAMRISEMFGVVEIVLLPLLFYAIRPKTLGVAFIVAVSAGNLALGLYQTELIQDWGH